MLPTQENKSLLSPLTDGMFLFETMVKYVFVIQLGQTLHRQFSSKLMSLYHWPYP